MLESRFRIDLTQQQGLSNPEKAANYWWQILNQCDHDFRTISEHVFPMLMMIGNQDPHLIIKHVQLLSSTRFLQGNIRVARAVLRGLDAMVEANPAFHSIIEQYSREQVEELLRKISGINNPEWNEVRQLGEQLLGKLNAYPVLLKKQTHISSGRPYDHLEAFASLILQAGQEFYLIDPYVGDDMGAFLWFLRKLDGSHKSLKILTKSPKSQEKQALESTLTAFAKQGNSVALRYDTDPKGLFHDRWCIIDGRDIYHIGASLRGVAAGASSKSFDINKVEDPQAISALQKDIAAWWQQSMVIM